MCIYVRFVYMFTRQGCFFLNFVCTNFLSLKIQENGIGGSANQEGYAASSDTYFTPRRAEGSNRSTSQAKIRGRYHPYMQ